MMNLKVKPLAVAVMMLSPAVTLNAQEGADGEVDEEVIVTGVRAAELNAREEERLKDSFSSIISQDDAGNFADQNVAESLKRLPGITLLKNEGEGRFISLRGLGPTFVSVNMNGNELATAGEDTRAFALDAIPSDMLGSIEVFKTLTPDQDLNSLAGSVNVKTISAFDRNKDSMKFKAQVNKQNYVDDYSPKLALSGTNLFADDTFGVGYSLSWEERTSVTYINVHHSDNPPRYINVDDELGLIPFRYESKQEDAKRTRAAGSVTLEYKPHDDHHLKLNLSRTEFEDIDIALREYHRWGQSSNSLTNPESDEIVYWNKEQNLYGMYGTDLQHQFFIQEGKSVTDAVSFGGEHMLGDNWELSYDLAASSSEWNKPGGRRVQFRIRELPMVGTHGANYYNSQIVDPAVLAAMSGEEIPSGAYYSEYTPDSRVQSGMVYDNLFIEDSFRNDEIAQIQADLRRNFHNTDFINYVKFGVAAKDRNRDRNKDRWSVVPTTYSVIGCPDSIDPELCSEWTTGGGATLGEFSTFTPSAPDIQYDFITKEDAERIIAVTEPIAYNSDQNLNDIDSTKDDYTLSEESSSIYAMAEFVPFENATLIAGAKYETTTFSSEGNFSLRNDREDDVDSGVSGDIVVPLPPAENSYSNILPSVHLKWEPSDELLFRAAIWTSFTRPGFDQARTRASITSRVEYCEAATLDTPNPNCGERRDLGGEDLDDETLFEDYVVSPSLGIDVGNPELEAMTAVNFDTSLSWFASQGLYMQAAFFYKDIENFIADIRGANLALEDLPVDLPLEEMSTVLPLQPNLVYENINYAVNGETAYVYGIELTLAKNWVNGLFVSGNATLQTSSAKLDESLRATETQLPFQADQIGNLTVGWENEDISVRFSSNYRSKVLERIGVCEAGDTDVQSCQTWNDVWDDSTFGLDFKASWNVTDNLNLYFDALNITGDIDVKYMQGNQYSNGKMLYQSEDFGSAFQLGLNYKFL